MGVRRFVGVVVLSLLSCAVGTSRARAEDYSEEKIRSVARNFTVAQLRQKISDVNDRIHALQLDIMTGNLPATDMMRKTQAIDELQSAVRAYERAIRYRLQADGDDDEEDDDEDDETDDSGTEEDDGGAVAESDRPARSATPSSRRGSPDPSAGPTAASGLAGARDSARAAASRALATPYVKGEVAAVAIEEAQRATAELKAGRFLEAGNAFVRAWRLDPSAATLGLRAGASYLLADFAYDAVEVLRRVLSSDNRAAVAAAQDLAARAAELIRQDQRVEDSRAAEGAANSGRLLLYASGAPGPLVQELVARLRAGRKVRSIAVGPGGSWAAAYGKDGAAWSLNCPEDLRARLRQLGESGEDIRSIALGDDETWAVVIGVNAGHWRGLPDYVTSAWRDWNARGKAIEFVAMGPEQSAFLGGDGYSLWGDESQRNGALVADASRQRSALAFRAAAMGPGGNFVYVFGRGGYQAVGPQGMLDALRAINQAGLGVQAVALGPTGGWVVVGER